MPRHDETSPGDPYERFAVWREGVRDAAMCLATVSPNGEPAARVVLLARFDREGFRFFTSYDSEKAHDLDSTLRGALVWYWPPGRQVRVAGAVGRVSVAEADAFWEARPRAHQLSVWASPQSSVVAGRSVLEERLAGTTARFGDGVVPRPPNWGGYVLAPDSFEFGRQSDDLLHARRRYRLVEGQWLIECLAP
jgi:pyridoxamine 5'-phosphate oxidase